MASTLSLLRTALVALFAAALAFAPAQAADIVIETIVEYEIVESDDEWEQEAAQPSAMPRLPRSSAMRTKARVSAPSPLSMIAPRAWRAA